MNGVKGVKEMEPINLFAPDAFEKLEKLRIESAQEQWRQIHKIAGISKEHERLVIEAIRSAKKTRNIKKYRIVKKVGAGKQWIIEFEARHSCGHKKMHRVVFWDSNASERKAKMEWIAGGPCEDCKDIDR